MTFAKILENYKDVPGKDLIISFADVIKALEHAYYPKRVYIHVMPADQAHMSSGPEHFVKFEPSPYWKEDNDAA